MTASISCSASLGGAGSAAARDGKVIEFTSEEIEKLQAEIARKLGYKLVDHRLELYCVPLDDDKS